jgi:toxin ParE1/3/4
VSAAGFDVTDIADGHIDDIYLYSRAHWGEARARDYIVGLYACFDAIAARRVIWRAIDADLGEGFVCHYKRHRIYWQVTGAERVVIVAVLHESMHQARRLRSDTD